jgi:hypothetical protein
MNLSRTFRDLISDVIRVFDQDRGLARQMLARIEADLTREIEASEERTPVYPAGEIARAAHESSSKFSAKEVKRLLDEGRRPVIDPLKEEP